MTIRKVCVIGAGVMGSGIAGHIANAGIPVLLLDRGALAGSAINRMAKTSPPPFMSRAAAGLVTPGSLDGDLAGVGACDWIIEAVVEDLSVKQALYRRLDEVRRPGGIVSSNTSTLPLARLTEGLSDEFRRDFLITHFFNPPRYLRLLELVAGPQTRAEAVADITDLADVRLGKGVVVCRDTPGFIANRIGTYWLMVALEEAMALGIGVAEADAVLSRPLGIPKTGAFGLLDLVGLDLIPLIGRSLAAYLPPDDGFHRLRPVPPLLERMIADGFTGRKGKGGFYRLDEQRRKLVLDLKDGSYQPAQKIRAPKLDEVLRSGELGGEYLRRVLRRTLGYVAGLAGEIADGVADIDRAMRLGYNWTYGPFELADRIGPARIAESLAAAGEPVPPLLTAAIAAGGFYRTDPPQAMRGDGSFAALVEAPGCASLARLTGQRPPLSKTASAVLHDIGDGVACLSFTGRMNALDAGVMDLIRQAVDLIPRKGMAGLVIHTPGERFTVGANLAQGLFAANIALWDAIDGQVVAGQQAYRALMYAPFPVVGAPSGLALGGGAELLLHCDHVQAHAESYIGLVEAGVGLVPGWGGCTRLLARAISLPGPRGPMPAVSRVFEVISTAKVSTSAEDARALGFLRPGDGITMNLDRLLSDAKARVLDMAPTYQPPAPPVFHLPGPSGRLALEMAVDSFRRMGRASAFDAVVAGELAGILTGGDTDQTLPMGEDDLLALERAAFARLVRHPLTLARMEHMLATGKPLRN